MARKEIKTKKQLVDLLRAQLGTNRNQALKALLFLYARQTEDEKRVHVVQVNNGIGFRCMDSQFLSSLAEQYIKKGYLSDKQIEILMQKLPCYAGQLIQNSLATGKIRKENGVYVW